MPPVPQHVRTYLKPPHGKFWHVADVGEGQSLCGQFSRRVAWVTLVMAEERADKPPLCRQCAMVLEVRARGAGRGRSPRHL